MHELSIANSLIDIATEHADAHGADRIDAITLCIGALSCVHTSALTFSFELIAKGTIAEGARLEFKKLPVTIFCAKCAVEVELPGIQRFCCPVCDTPSADIRQGRELEVATVAVSNTPPKQEKLTSH